MEEKIREILGKVFNGSKYSIIDLVIRGEKKNKIAEIYVDCEESVNLDELSKLSREVNEALDSDEIIDEFLKIVVSSPGAENPFKHCWQLKKHTGRVFRFRHGDEAYEGTLVFADTENDELTFEVIKSKKETVEFRGKFAELEDLKVKLPF